MRRFLTAVVGLAGLAAYVAIVGNRVSEAESPAPEKVRQDSIAGVLPHGLIVHEWGTFTSISGSNGVPVSFQPDNSSLPPFVYHHAGKSYSKSLLLLASGTVSMETPVIYFYTDREVQASIRVGFRKGWITEWYPHAAISPDGEPRFEQPPDESIGWPGESIGWDVRLLPGEPLRPDNGIVVAVLGTACEKKDKNPYYHARETDAVALQATFELPDGTAKEMLHGGAITQREKFLFYRGVGTFPPPVTVRAEGGGKVRVTNAANGRVTGVVLVTVRDGRIGLQAVNDLEAGAEAVATLPETMAGPELLGAAMEKALIAAGLYEREAQAMVKTWEHAWFHEEGARLLYLLPRAQTDGLLPLAVSPKPTEVVRVIVGRHDFLTPEQEATVERQLKRQRSAQLELAEAAAELAKIGRFSQQAQQMALERLNKARQKPMP